jgi:hypothetical protein
MKFKKHIFLLLTMVITSALFASGCDDDACSFENDDSLPVFYGSHGAYEVWASKNSGDEVFVNLGTEIAIDASLRSVPDAATLIIDTQKINSLFNLLKSREVKFDLYKLKEGQLEIIVNDAFLKVCAAKSLTNAELKNLILTGKVENQDIYFILPYENSATMKLFLNTFGIELKDFKANYDILSCSELNDKSKEFATSSSPILYITNTPLVEKYNRDQEWLSQGWKNLQWSDAMNISFMMVVLKGKHNEDIIALLKKMGATLIGTNQ